jgi:hypothetical protein
MSDCYNSQLPIGPQGPTGPIGATGPAGPTYIPPYKVYTALLGQNGITNPAAIVLENTLGFTPTWVRNAAGDYSSNNGGWLQGITNQKIFVIITPTTYNLNQNIFRICSDVDLLRIQIYTGNYDINTSTFTGVDGLLSDEDNFVRTSIEIRIYP